MIQTKFYFDDVWKQRLKQVNVPKIDVERIEGNGRSYPYLYPIGDLVLGSFRRGFHALTKESSWNFSKLKWIRNYLLVNNDASNDVGDYVRANDDASDDACNYVGANNDAGNYIGANDKWWWCSVTLSHKSLSTQYLKTTLFI